MSRIDIPIACTLTQEERPARREMLLAVGRKIAEVQERENGFAYRFASDAMLPSLIEVIRAERACCAFLRFALTFEEGHGPVWLEVTGPEGTRDFLKSFWGQTVDDA